MSLSPSSLSLSVTGSATNGLPYQTFLAAVFFFVCALWSIHLFMSSFSSPFIPSSPPFFPSTLLDSRLSLCLPVCPAWQQLYAAQLAAMQVSPGSKQHGGSLPPQANLGTHSPPTNTHPQSEKGRSSPQSNKTKVRIGATLRGCVGVNRKAGASDHRGYNHVVTVRREVTWPLCDATAGRRGPAPSCA